MKSLSISLFFLFIAIFSLRGQSKYSIDTSYISVQVKNGLFYYIKDNDKAMFHFKLAYERAKKLNDLALLAKVENHIGDVYWYMSDYQNASSFYFSALKHFEKTTDSIGMADSYRSIGWIYLGNKNYSLAEKYLLKYNRLSKKIRSWRSYHNSLNDLALLKSEQKQYAVALFYLDKQEQISLKYAISSPGNLSSTRAKVYLDMHDYDKAEKFSLISVKELSMEPNSDYNLSSIYGLLFEIYFNQKKYALAEEYGILAVDIADKCKFGDLQTRFYENLASLYHETKDFKKAYEFTKKRANLLVNLHEVNRSDYIKNNQNKLDAKEKQLAQQELKQNVIQQKAKAEKDQQFRYFLFTIIGVILIFSLFVIRQFYLKKKANHNLQKAYEVIEEKNQSISDSIAYARNIQHARLPKTENIEESFPDHFVLYEPRDIVSGDFYWFDNHLDAIYIAVADCTGHGIPGAFMSMIGIDGFNYAILENKIAEPSKILQHVDQFIKTSLNQHDIDSKSRDGMDVALLTISKDFRRLAYSGANRPLWIVRKGEIIELSPNKISIGGNYELDFSFQEQSIELQKGDKIYAFSDGYADQFGGETEKKFMTKNFKKLLLSIEKESMEKQGEKVKEAFMNWKGKLDQVDDVLVLGIKI